MITKNDAKLIAGMLGLRLDRKHQLEGFRHPFGSAVIFMLNLPEEYNGWELLGGKNHSLAYHFIDKPEEKIVITWDWGIPEYGPLSKEDADYLSDLFKPLAKDIMAKATTKKLFDEISCTEEAQTINCHRFDEFVDGMVKIRRDWFDFFFDKDYNVAESKSLFRHYVTASDGGVYSLLPNEQYPDRFIETPHIDRERRKSHKYPNTNFEGVDAWLAHYGVNKPVTLEVEVTDELKSYIRTRENKDDWRYMTREEYEAASKADPEKYTPVPQRKS